MRGGVEGGRQEVWSHLLVWIRESFKGAEGLEVQM